jgi:hypothetical protein
MNMQLRDLRRLADALESILQGSVSDLIDMSPAESEQRLQGFDFIIRGFGIKKITIEDQIMAAVRQDMSRHAAARPQQDNSKRIAKDEEYRHERDL